MLNEIKKHIAAISLELQTRINIEWDFACDSPTDIWPTSREQYRVNATGYEYIYRMNVEQIMNITIHDFIKKEAE